ncbi:predicted protein [Sclerotinia sclerotiorum 1980 UF-70]|uniref:Uncharacterized protein n=1 Tax=Sclerotinia sclerotiorum (strain ATCC 18683 / 1980 / Ss-1) TaxID=665079 RepID=A7EXS6_SCLS1|nr:predicted protein [Sclerotinia sclerotiorum 1980 UF-70]EDN94268.1 predicted protein [Sclerotinia sclerotiorum 1980 UF-70]
MFNQEEVIISQLACLRKKEDRNYRGLWFYLLILGISKCTLSSSIWGNTVPFQGEPNTRKK